MLCFKNFHLLLLLLFLTCLKLPAQNFGNFSQSFQNILSAPQLLERINQSAEISEFGLYYRRANAADPEFLIFQGDTLPAYQLKPENHGAFIQFKILEEKRKHLRLQAYVNATHIHNGCAHIDVIRMNCKLTMTKTGVKIKCKRAFRQIGTAKLL